MPRITGRRTSSGVINSRAVNPAVQSVPFYSEKQQQKVLNTLEAGQIRATIYIRKSDGLECTCTGEVSVLTQEGELPESSIQQILQNSGGKVEREVFCANDFDLDETTSDNFLVDDDLDDDGIADDMELGILDFGAVSCAVCYTSGWVGGYDLHNGHRLVLAVPNPNTVTEFTVDKTVSPHAFAPTAATGVMRHVEFSDVLVPFGATTLAYRLKNNHDTIPYSEYTLSVWDGAAWTTLTNLNDLANGLPRMIRITTNRKFTHFEANYTVNNSITYIDFPQLNINDFVKNLAGDLGETDMNLGSNIPHLPRWSVIKDSKYGRSWQITTMTPVYTSDKTVTSWEANARLIHEQENIHDIL
ncbi:hypothetical protein GR11A_00031 [Vibrio phage vB_VcorM_GR11A]|nr:hypothetical protein GR11A_00031 [Vibrio phage vB_VcorM_GR11A]